MVCLGGGLLVAVVVLMVLAGLGASSEGSGAPAAGGLGPPVVGKTGAHWLEGVSEGWQCQPSMLSAGGPVISGGIHMCSWIAGHIGLNGWSRVYLGHLLQGGRRGATRRFVSIRVIYITIIVESVYRIVKWDSGHRRANGYTVSG